LVARSTVKVNRERAAGRIQNLTRIGRDSTSAMIPEDFMRYALTILRDHEAPEWRDRGSFVRRAIRPVAGRRESAARESAAAAQPGLLLLGDTAAVSLRYPWAMRSARLLLT
jgi:hypothetical protein